MRVGLSRECTLLIKWIVGVDCHQVENNLLEHIGRLVRMSILDTEVDGSNPGSSMLFP